MHLAYMRCTHLEYRCTAPARSRRPIVGSVSGADSRWCRSQRERRQLSDVFDQPDLNSVESQLSDVAMLRSFVLIAFPTAVAPPMIASAIKAAISAYSIAEAPDSQRMKRLTRSFMAARSHAPLKRA